MEERLRVLRGVAYRLKRIWPKAEKKLEVQTEGDEVGWERLMCGLIGKW